MIRPIKLFKQIKCIKKNNNLINSPEKLDNHQINKKYILISINKLIMILINNFINKPHHFISMIISIKSNKIKKSSLIRIKNFKLIFLKNPSNNYNFIKRAKVITIPLLFYIKINTLNKK